MIKPEYRGVSHHRYEREPLERLFAEKWQEINDRHLDPDATLKYLLSEDNKPVRPSDRDRLVAATIIQWLGSPVGQAFLKNVEVNHASR